MSLTSSHHDQRFRRAVNACISCRERKVKCSGNHPCNNCVRRSTTCVFDQDDRKVTVSERFLNELKRKASYNDLHESGGRRKHSRQQREQGSGKLGPSSSFGIPSSDGGSPRDQDDHDHDRPANLTTTSNVQNSVMANPLANEGLKYVIDNNGRKRFLGPSSTWAYSQQVMVMIKSHLNQVESPEVPLHVDGNAYRFDWSSTVDAKLTRDDIPSLDYAIYLMNTVKFHVCQLYHIFDEEIFLQGLYEFYEERAPETLGTRLWYIQFLLVIALGKAFLVQNGASNVRVGANFFRRAMKLLPDVHDLYEDTFLSIEILCAISLYLQSVDHRNSAYTYLGMALRISLTQGMHRELPVELQAGNSSARHRSIWWTLYILDRKLSSLMGAPISIQDEDITLGLPSVNNSAQKSNALRIHVKLSRLIAQVLNTVYGVDGRLDSSFLKGVQKVLRNMATIAPEIEEQFGVNVNSPGTTSRVSATLNLCYHQCVILATRPLLICLLSDKLEHTYERRTVIDPVKALIKACYDSAVKSLKILHVLKGQDLLESFLPFDLENAYSSAFVLELINAIHSPFEGYRHGDFSHMSLTSSILNTMIEKGSIPAVFRNSELERLQSLVQLMLSQQQNPATEIDNLTSEAEESNETLVNGLSVQDSVGHDNQMIGYIHSPVGIGLSPDDMLEVVHLLESDHTFLNGVSNMDANLNADGLWRYISEG